MISVELMFDCLHDWSNIVLGRNSWCLHAIVLSVCVCVYSAPVSGDKPTPLAQGSLWCSRSHKPVQLLSRLHRPRSHWPAAHTGVYVCVCVSARVCVSACVSICPDCCHHCTKVVPKIWWSLCWSFWNASTTWVYGKLAASCDVMWC